MYTLPSIIHVKISINGTLSDKLSGAMSGCLDNVHCECIELGEKRNTVAAVIGGFLVSRVTRVG